MHVGTDLVEDQKGLISTSRLQAEWDSGRKKVRVLISAVFDLINAATLSAPVGPVLQALDRAALVSFVVVLNGPLGLPLAVLAWVTFVIGVYFLRLARVREAPSL